MPPGHADIVPGSDASLADYAPNILRNYFDNFPNTFLTRHHMDSYETFVFGELPDIIKSENPLTVLKEPLDTKKGIYKYKTEIFIGGDKPNASDLAIDIGPPVIVLDNGRTVRRMFPNEARLRDLTYAVTFQADILVRITYTTINDSPRDEDDKWKSEIRELNFEKFPLFKIPILLRSKLCATHGANPALLFEMGECRNDHGGYFIIDGAEKLLITRQEQAFNSIYVAVKPKHDLKINTYASVICQHPVTKQTRRVALYRLHKTDFFEEGAIRISIPQVKGAIPVFALFRALGVISDLEIIRMILPDTSAALTKTMESTLIASIHDAMLITTAAQAIEFIRTLTKGFVVANVLDILHTHLFSHVPDRPFARAQYLAEIIRKMIRTEMGLEPSTNRDDIRNQRLLPTGTLLRGLFSESWKLWKKTVRLNVDKQYNYNKSLYQDENFLTIFGAGNISNVLSSKDLNDSIMRGFRGQWGTNQYTIKKGVIQPVARISYMDAMSHTRRVVSDFDTSMKLTGPRSLHTSQVGYFCTSETPTGGHIGATKNLSIMTIVSVATEFTPLMNWLFARGGVVEVGSAPVALAATATSVQINGGTIGFTQDPVILIRVLKAMKWTACLPPTSSISFNTSDNILRIFMDDGRPLRPLWHLGGGVGQGKWPRVMREYHETKTALPAWRDLVCGTFPPTREFEITSSAFVDPLFSAEKHTLEDYEKLLVPHCGAIEYVDPYEGNEAYISWWGRADALQAEHTHSEIHPSTLLGLLASMIPFSNHNQSPRNQLSCSQSKQSIGYYATNFENRFDTYGSMLCYGEGPLCRTIVYDAVGGGAMPYGANIIFAINSFNGYNQDDGILFNRSSIERGLFRSLALRSYTTVEEEDPITKAVYRIGNPRNILAWTDLKPGNDYSQLDDNGIIREGVAIHDHTVLVGRYMLNRETGHISDASLTPTVFTNGRVDKVVVLHQANGMRLVRIRILEERVPELGDKFSSRHGQKGTIGMLLDAQDMPRTADGMVPDVMVNPHCIPSRMTIAQLLEQVFGKLGAHIGAKMNATPFMNDQQSYTAIADALESLGIQRDGEEILYSGITGKMFTSSVFMGPLYFMRIKHLVQDKLNVRGPGRREQLTHQPTGGRGNEGGMRIGEMERDSLIAHGIADFLQESMMKRSDGTSFVVCNGCGTIPIYNEDFKFYVCSLCDGPLTWQGTTPETKSIVLPVRKSRTTFSRVEIPYALKLCDQELTTYMNAGFRFLTAKMARHFREPTEDTIEELFEAQVLEDKADVMDENVEEVEDMKGNKSINRKFKKTGAETGDGTGDGTGDEDKPVTDDTEDAPKDLIDEGQPSHNESTTVPEYPPGTQIIEFTSATKEYKEFTTYFPVKLTINDKVWATVEHYFQAMKFPDNAEFQERLRLTGKPAEVKRLAKTMEQTQRPDWNTHRDEVMYVALREKFSDKHPELKAKLLSTGNAVIRDGSPQDNYWGIGRSKKGKNRLGVLLMKVRDELIAESGTVGGALPAVGASALDAMMTTTVVKEQTAAAAQAAAAAAAVPATDSGTNAITVNIGAIPGTVGAVGAVGAVEAVEAPVPAPVNMENPSFSHMDTAVGAVGAVGAPVAQSVPSVTVEQTHIPPVSTVPQGDVAAPGLPTIPPAMTAMTATMPYVPSANPPVLRIDEVSATEQIPESDFKTITVTAPIMGKK